MSERAVELAAPFEQAHRALIDEVERLADDDVEWATVFAFAVTPEAVVPKQFSVPDFDQAAHLASCLNLLRERLARAEHGDPLRFPSPHQ